MNNKLTEEMANGPPPPEPPEFRRGPITSDFTGRIKRTRFQLFDYKEKIKVPIIVDWSEKTRVFKISEDTKGGRKDKRAGTKWEKLISG